ncbi:DUF4072 domain-containing protein [Pseudomonas brassicacearum]|nr:DUF4072 domain-containing protein [Pseudomonas brassicacearum]
MPDPLQRSHLRPLLRVFQAKHYYRIGNVRP